jgi:hypothetical protein
MISNWILDISIGCLLLISIGLFYETTVIFYTMFNWWMIIFLLPFVAICNLADRSREVLNDELEILTQAKSIDPAEKETLFSLVAIYVMWLIPITVDLIFGGVAIFSAHLFNSNLSLGDIYAICLTPATLLIVLYCSRNVYEMLFNDINEIKHPIYNESGVAEVIVNTCVIEWGGYSIAKILGIG